MVSHSSMLNSSSTVLLVAPRNSPNSSQGDLPNSSHQAGLSNGLPSKQDLCITRNSNMGSMDSSLSSPSSSSSSSRQWLSEGQHRRGSSSLQTPGYGLRTNLSPLRRQAREMRSMGAGPSNSMGTQLGLDRLDKQHSRRGSKAGSGSPSPTPSNSSSPLEAKGCLGPVNRVL